MYRTTVYHFAYSRLIKLFHHVFLTFLTYIVFLFDWAVAEARPQRSKLTGGLLDASEQLLLVHIYAMHISFAICVELCLLQLSSHLG